MKIFIFILFCIFSVTALAVETELSGNIEAQGRQSWNNPQAQEFPLMQTWDKEKFYLVYGNLNGKAEFDSSRLEANWFVRHSQSELYRNQYLATQIFNFPNKLVARDVFKLQHRKQEDNYQTDSIINKLYYEWDSGENNFAVGRMYINYGQGEIFNPINPFNQPTGLTSISQVAQGNDGGMFKYFVDDQHSVEFYLLGDKAINNYDGDGSISRTLWTHGEYQATENLQIDYVLGEDQKREKVGGQLSYRLEEAMIFAQTLYQSEYINDNSPSHNLLDAVMGYDEQLTSKWHLRLETGYQKKNLYSTLANFGERFLPTEYFVAAANQFEVHPLIKINGTIIADFKTGFAYAIVRSSFDLGHNMEADLFAFCPVAKGKDEESVAQKLVTTDVGFSLRAFF